MSSRLPLWLQMSVCILVLPRISHSFPAWCPSSLHFLTLLGHQCTFQLHCGSHSASRICIRPGSSPWPCRWPLRLGVEHCSSHDPSGRSCSPSCIIECLAPFLFASSSVSRPSLAPLCLSRFGFRLWADQQARAILCWVQEGQELLLRRVSVTSVPGGTFKTDLD